MRLFNGLYILLPMADANGISSHWRMKKHQKLLWILDFINKKNMRCALCGFSLRSSLLLWNKRNNIDTPQLLAHNIHVNTILKYSTLNQNWRMEINGRRTSLFLQQCCTYVLFVPFSPYASTLRKRKTDQIQMQIKVFALFCHEWEMMLGCWCIADPIELSSKQEGFLYVFFHYFFLNYRFFFWKHFTPIDSCEFSNVFVYMLNTHTIPGNRSGNMQFIFGVRGFYCYSKHFI